MATPRGVRSLTLLAALLVGALAFEGCGGSSEGTGSPGRDGGTAGSAAGAGGTPTAGVGAAGIGAAGIGAAGIGAAGVAGQGVAGQGVAGAGIAGAGGMAGATTPDSGVDAAAGAAGGGVAGAAGEDGGAGASGHDGGAAGHDAAVDTIDSGADSGTDAVADVGSDEGSDVPTCGADGTSCAAANGAAGYCLAKVCKVCVDTTDDAKCVTAYGAGQICAAGKCVAGDCHTSAGCGTGRVCGATVAHKCGPCASDTQCQTDTHYGAGFICDTTTGHTESGTCVSSTCTELGTCSANAGDTCCQMKCVTGNCCSDADCHNDSQFGPNYFCSANHVCSTCAAPAGNQYFVDPVGGVDATATGSGKVGTAATPSCSFKTITRALQVIGNAPPAGTTITVVGVANATTALVAAEDLPIIVPANVTIATSVGPISVTLDADGSGFALAGDGATIAAAAVAPLTIDGAGHTSGMGIAVAPGAGKTAGISNVAIKNTGDDGIAVMNGTLAIGPGVTVTSAGHATATGRRSGLHIAGGVVNIVVPEGQTPSTFTANTLHGIEVTDLGVLNVTGVPVTDPITGAGTVVASGNSRSNIFISQTPGMAPSLSTLDGVVAWDSTTAAGIEIIAGSHVNLRNSISLNNTTDGVLITTADATTAGEAIANIDLGTAGSFGENTLQLATAAVDHSNPGAGICLQLDPNSGTQTLAAAGNIFAGPLDCSKPTPGGALKKAGTCANHVDEAIVVPSAGTTATIVSSNCL
jgi:hypothetical protein